MDCQTPVMDGFEATRRIRAWEVEQGRARLPIVALTASAFDTDRLRSLEAGMDDFLTKPASMQTLTRHAQASTCLNPSETTTGSRYHAIFPACITSCFCLLTLSPIVAVSRLRRRARCISAP